MPANHGPLPGDLLDLACVCASTRRAARALTQLYDGFLRDHGIEAAQFALLSAMQGMGPSSQAAIGRALGLDKTTLSRNVRVLQSAGWIERIDASGGRERGFSITLDGRRVLKAARPAWLAAQAALRTAMAPDRWRDVQATMQLVTHAARQAIHRHRNRQAR